MKILMYADFCKLLPTTKDILLDNLSKDIFDCRVLFIPLATENKSYVSKCYNSLKNLGFKVDNIESINPMISDENFDVVFVCGGNNAVLKEKLIKWNWWNKLKNLILNNALYIGDSAGGVILGKSFAFSLDYEPYNGPLNDFSGYNIIDKYIVMHYSTIKMSSDGKLNDATEYFNTHHDKLIELGKENCLTVGNNELYVLTDDIQKMNTYDWEEVQNNFLSGKLC